MVYYKEVVVMKKFLLLILVLLLCLFMNSMFVSARYLVTRTDNTTFWNYLEVPDTEKYILDEEANKDKLNCKTKSDGEGNVIQTDWYNFCTGEFVKSEDVDTCTKELRYPEYECVFAKGSNADKLYCRTLKDGEGNVVETRWFNFCSNELVKTEEADTCTKEFKNPQHKCYKEEIEEIIEEEEEAEEIPEEMQEEEETVEIPPEETVTEEPEVTPTKADKTWMWVLALIIAIVIVAVFLKKKKKSKKEESEKEK